LLPADDSQIEMESRRVIDVSLDSCCGSFDVSDVSPLLLPQDRPFGMRRWARLLSSPTRGEGGKRKSPLRGRHAIRSTRRQVVQTRCTHVCAPIMRMCLAVHPGEVDIPVVYASRWNVRLVSLSLWTAQPPRQHTFGIRSVSR